MFPLPGGGFFEAIDEAMIAIKIAGYDPNELPADLIDMVPRTSGDLKDLEDKASGPALSPSNQTEEDELAAVRPLFPLLLETRLPKLTLVPPLRL